MKTLIVADDLTGALDSAVTFAGVGLRCTVARRPADIPAAMATAPDVLAVSTASREGSPEAATCAVSHVFDAIGDRPKLVFKKVDSRLKGHCAAELGMVAARTGIGRAVVTPAIPAQGRATQGGQLSGAGVASPIDVAAIFAEAGVRVEVPDAATDADLDRVVTAAMSGDPVLLVGAAGLAAALARHLRPGARPTPVGNLPAPLLLAIGSRDPITLAQLDALRAAGVQELPAPDGRVEMPTGGIRHDALLLRLVTGGDPFDPFRANDLFAAVRVGVRQVRGRGYAPCLRRRNRGRHPGVARRRHPRGRGRGLAGGAGFIDGCRRSKDETRHQVRRVRRT